MNFISNMLVSKPLKEFAKILKSNPGVWAYRDVSAEVCGPDVPDLDKVYQVSHASGSVSAMLYIEKSGRKLSAFTFASGDIETPKTQIDNDYLCKAIEDYLALPEDTPITVEAEAAL